jgi:hypothetical protein
MVPAIGDRSPERCPGDAANRCSGGRVRATIGAVIAVAVRRISVRLVAIGGIAVRQVTVARVTVAWITVGIGIRGVGIAVGRIGVAVTVAVIRRVIASEIPIPPWPQP